MNRHILLIAGWIIVAGSGQTNEAQAESNKPYPLEYWALRDVISNVQISPDGKYLGLMTIPTKDGDPIIEVYDAANMDAEPFRLNADPMEITNFYWVSDKDIVFTLRQQVRDLIEGYNQGVYEFRLAVVDVESKKIKSFEEVNPAVENLLPNKPGKIIISFQEGALDEDDPASKLSEPFRPRAYWEFDLDKGTKQLIIRGKIALGNIEFDGDGNPWLARGFDRAAGEFVWYTRERGSRGWKELYRLDEFSFEDFFVEGFDPAKPGNLLVRTQRGNDKRGLWSFNRNTRQFDELIYRRSDVDVAGVRFHSNTWTEPGTIVGVAYQKDKIYIEYFDEIEGATYAQIEQLIPHAHYVRITSRSRDGNTMTMYNLGPKDPGTYYVLKDGQLKLVGSSQPLFNNEELADVKYITYEARDGRMVPGYLTIPKGEGPFPTVVLPHGGPYVEEVVIYDELSQMFANNGYLVLQPQYRGSRNHGLDHWMSAFKGGSQAGRKMQDDKDDGALHLVDEGLADPERLTIVGGSYGGYAALVAASRTPQIYQCTIGIAVVSDTVMQVNFARDTLRGSAVESWLDLWLESINPVKEVAKVNVPVLIVHGTVDQRTPPVNAKKYVRELEEHGKTFKYVPLDGADHFFNTFTYEHWNILYESMINFLNNDCGNISRELQARN